jgi:LPS-assembly protein
VDHQATPLDNLYTNVLFQEVSDDQYLNDFSNSLDLLNPTYLERHANATYFSENWSLFGRFQNYQTLDPEIFDNDEPYARLPQLLFTGSWRQGYNKPIYELRGEVVNFNRDSGVNATRLDILPALSLPLQWPAGYVSPRLSYRLTNYNLQNTTPAENSSPSRDAPIFSLDTGLFFERAVAGSKSEARSGLLTLEPRLYYLYVPFRDQSDIPIFDSAQFDPSYTGFFLENRFTGADRLGDANQLTTALTSRFLDSQGREQGRVNVGQVQFFENRQVTLNEKTAIATERARTSSSSRFIGEAEASLGHGVSLRGSMQWDPLLRSTIRRALNLGYVSGTGKLLNGAYRFTRDTLEELDFSVVWPMGQRWRTVGRWNYSLLTNRSIDTLAGVEYRDCCWTLRFLGRQQRINPRDDETKNLFYVELELRGLGGIGTTSIERLLEGVISGYPRASY